MYLWHDGNDWNGKDCDAVGGRGCEYLVSFCVDDDLKLVLSIFVIYGHLGSFKICNVFFSICDLAFSIGSVGKKRFCGLRRILNF